MVEGLDRRNLRIGSRWLFFPFLFLSFLCSSSSLFVLFDSFPFFFFFRSASSELFSFFIDFLIFDLFVIFFFTLFVLSFIIMIFPLLMMIRSAAGASSERCLRSSTSSDHELEKVIEGERERESRFMSSRGSLFFF